MLNKNIKLPIEELDYLVSNGFNMIKKIIRRCRIKRIFKYCRKEYLYKYFIDSYNSCFESTLEDSKLYDLVISGILICVEEDSEDQNLSTYRRIRMNPQLFKLIIF